MTGYHGDTLASALLANGVSLVWTQLEVPPTQGILGSGVEEPNALDQLNDGAHAIPLSQATTVELTAGLVAKPVNVHPSVETDWRSVNGWFSRLMPAGFYYKTFMASQAAWHFFERQIAKPAA